MISYITLGTNQLEKARSFYDGLLAEFNYSRIHDDTRFSFYMGDGPGLMLAIPFNEKPASSGNGTMIALSADNNEKVDAVYKKAIALGASCEGKPGDRGNGASYAAYFRDPDGNKFAVIKLATQ